MKSRLLLRVVVCLFCLGLLQACSYLFPPDDIDPSAGLDREDYIALRHREADAKPGEPPIPDMPSETVPPPPPALGSDKLVSVTVTDSVPVRDVLIELAREAKVNLELDPRVQGGVIFSAHDQPFDQVLKRICALAGLRYKLDGAYIHIETDDPYQVTYQLDYLSLSRKTSSETSIATNVFDVDVANGVNGSIGTSSGNGSGTSSTENNSIAKVSGTAEADFWSEVNKSVTQIMASSGRKTDKENRSGFSIDKQAGMVTVFGDSQQQDAISKYFQKLRRKAYTVSPEQKVSIDTPSGPQGLAASSVTLSADAALDTYVYAFLDHLRETVPGRLRLQQFSLERIGGGNATLTATNIRFTATCEWLSNGATKDVAGTQ